MKYMVQLDGLRAVAILLVLMQHFSPETSLIGSYGTFPIGFLGVDLFFVLSGFLITGILLKARSRAEPWRTKARTFFVRRTLRLFPVYFLVLLVAVWFDYRSARSAAPWLFTYTSNFLSVRDGALPLGFEQFWSLGIEEQFYLVWPWVVLFVPDRWLGRAFLLMFLSGPLTRLGLVLTGSSEVTVRFHTLCVLDLFGCGALLALAHHRGLTPHRERWIATATRTGVSLAVALLAMRASGLPLVSSTAFVIALGSFANALAFTGVIHACAVGSRRTIARALELGPIAYVGRISYGIYVYHNFVEDLLPAGLARLGVGFPESGVARFVLLTAATVLVASLSWCLFEKPINALKDRVGTRRSRSTVPRSESVVAVACHQTAHRPPEFGDPFSAPRLR